MYIILRKADEESNKSREKIQVAASVYICVSGFKKKNYIIFLSVIANEIECSWTCV